MSEDTNLNETDPFMHREPEPLKLQAFRAGMWIDASKEKFLDSDWRPVYAAINLLPVGTQFRVLGWMDTVQLQGVTDEERDVVSTITVVVDEDEDDAIGSAYGTTL